jgi:hypothetical protein
MGASPLPLEEAPASERPRRLAEIERAIHSRQWDEAQSLLRTFEDVSPHDAALARLQEQLVARRREATREHLAQLEAARQANDPERVVELYHVVGSALASEERTSLERDLARWFLALIHRRLRTGKIQTEVVLLATRAAETFSATVEGASLRAALPTLRRSVGLCPRCARPYAGSAQACPQCLAGVAHLPAHNPSDQDSIPP